MISPQYQQLWVSPEQFQLQEIQTPTREPPQPKPVRSTRRFVTALSPFLMVAGYMIIPIAFETPEQNPQVDNTSWTVAATVLIGVAYALSLVVVCFQIHHAHYLLHSVFLPCLASSLLSLLNIALNIHYRNLLPLGNLETISISIACAFTLLYTLGALWIYGRNLVNDFRANSNAATLLTDEELQRQQFSRLLDDQRKRSSASSKAVQKTFKVNTPESVSSGRGWDHRISSPRDMGYYS